MELSAEKLNKLLTTTEVAEMFDTSPRIVRREAKKGNIPGFYEVLGQFGFDPEEVEDWEPDLSTSTYTRSSRTDGRLRWKIWLTKEEEEALEAEGYEIENPRKIARQRRAARKAREEGEEGNVEEAEIEVPEEEAEENDPFAGFGG